MLTVPGTRGAGCPGSHRAEAFLARGDAVVALDTASQSPAAGLGETIGWFRRQPSDPTPAAT